MPWKPDWPRLRRFFLRTVAGLAVLSIVAWLGVPPLAKSLLQDRVSEQLGRTVTVSSVHFNPLLLRLSLDELVVAGASTGRPPLLSIGRLAVDLASSSFWHRAPVVEALRIERPRLSLARTAEGHYDVDDVLARLQSGPPPAPDARPLRFAVYNVQIEGGEIDVDDQPAHRQHQVRALALGVPFLSNLDERSVQLKVEPRLAFQLDGTPFDTGAQATPFASDRAGSLTLRTGDIDLAEWLPYVPASVPVQARQGRLSLDLHMQFAAPAGAAPRISLQGQGTLKSLQLTDRAGAELGRLGQLALNLKDLEPLRRQVVLDRLTLDGIQLDLARDAHGMLNWLQAVVQAPAPASGAPKAAAAEAPPGKAETVWQLRLGQLGLRNGQVAWVDDSVRPTARLQLQQVTVDAQQLRWPLVAEEQAHWSASAQLSAPAANAAKLATVKAAAESVAAQALGPTLGLEGVLSAQAGEVKAVLSQWELAHFAPYVAQYLRPRLEGQASMQATLNWAGPPGAAPPQLAVAQLQVDKLRLTDTLHRAPALAEWGSLALTDLQVDPAAHQIKLAKLALNQPSVVLERDAEGQLAWRNWLVAQQPAGVEAKPVQAAAASPVWRFVLQELALEGGQARWRDALPGAQPVNLDLTGLKLGARGLQWPAQTAADMKLQGSARLAAPSADKASPGRLEWAGQVNLARPSWKGRVRMERLPLHALAPYLKLDLPVSLAHADADWTGDTAFRLGEEGVSLNLQGEARLNDLHLQGQVSQGAQGDELLSWHALSLKGLRVALAPGARPQVDVAEATLADFYAALLVTEQGRFNLNDLSARPGNQPAGAAPVPGLPASANAAPASAPAAAAGHAWPLALTLGGVQLLNGKIDFVDHFIRPNYSAALSELNGRLGAFRSDAAEPATLELHGKVAGTAALDVRGAVNPASRPLSLDIQARATDLDLAPFSPYAGKYAGYAIERGKLSMDVSYRIQPDGQLAAQNQIVLNQLTFGERIDSPDATRLPVLLAVALLKDRNGVIDLNLPIGGSINDPQFSLGGLILKVIVNLLGKALTAPFALLSGGGGDDLSVVGFQPGTAVPATAGAEAVNKVARALADRPALQLTLAGEADPLQERAAIQAAQLQARLLAERRKEWLQAGESPATDPPPMTAEDRARLLQRVYRDTKLANKPRNMVGLAKDIAPAEMEALLLPSFPVTDEVARDLALRRGEAVRDALLAQGLPNERLFLAAPKLHAASAAEGAAWTPRVQMSLASH